MSSHKWYSKQDVINDLAQATGRYVRGINDEGLLVGEQPPPRLSASNEDAELELLRLYGGCRPQPPAMGGMGKPDLAGITHMLRMVELTDESFGQEMRNSPEKLKISPRKNETAPKCTTDILTISKLNPEVNEFVPKTKCEMDLKSNDPEVGNAISDLTSSSVNFIDPKLTPDEVKNMREKLKSKISATSKSDCVTAKRERNLAIASLLKLYCHAPKVAAPVDIKPKLITPDYFEKPVKLADKCEAATLNGGIYTDDTSKKLIVKSFDNTCEEGCKKISETVNGVQYPDNLTEANLIPKQILADSVDKVEKWFCDLQEASKKVQSDEVNISSDLSKKSDSTIKIKRESNNTPSSDISSKNTVYLGTVTFKKKSTSKSHTSNKPAEQETNVQKCVPFVPSQYANQLVEKYKEKSHSRKVSDPDIWSKLVNELQAKDAVIKKRQEEQQLAQSDEQLAQSDEQLAQSEGQSDASEIS